MSRSMPEIETPPMGAQAIHELTHPGPTHVFDPGAPHTVEVGVGVPPPMNPADRRPALIPPDGEKPIIPDEFYGSLITEKETPEDASGGSYIRKVLNEDGKDYLKKWFQRDFVGKNGLDGHGYIKQEAYDAEIQKLKDVLIDKEAYAKGKRRNINPSLRTDTQHFAASALKSLEMHRRRLADADIYGTLRASNSPWEATIKKTQEHLQKQNPRLNEKMSRKAAEQMLIPAIKVVSEVAEKITNDQLAQQYVAARVAQVLPLRLERYVMDENNRKQGLSGRDLIANALAPIDAQGRFQIDEIHGVKEKLQQNLQLEAVRQRAGAQLDYYLNETYESPTAMQQAGAEFIQRYIQSAGVLDGQLLRELSGADATFIQDPQDLIGIADNLSQKNARLIQETREKGAVERPFMETMGNVTQEEAQVKLEKMRAGWGDFIQTPEQAADMLLEIYKTQGMTHEDAILLVTDEKWVQEMDSGSVRRAFEKKHGYSHDQYKMELVRKRLGFWEKRDLAKAEKKLGRPIVTFSELEQTVSLESPPQVVKSFMKIVDKANEVLKGDYTKEKADKQIVAINVMRLGFTLALTPSSAPAWDFLAEKVSETEWAHHIQAQLDAVLPQKVDLQGKLVGVDINGDNNSDIYVTAEEAKNHAVIDQNGHSVVHIDSNADGIVDFTVATPTPIVEATATEHATQTTHQETEHTSQSEHAIDEAASHQTTPSQDAEAQSSLEWIDEVNAQAQIVENERPLIERVLAPIIDPIKQGRIEYCNQNGEWCDTFLGKEGKEFNGMVVWVIGVDDWKIGGRGDAIHGFVLNADTGKISEISLNRDIRVPGLDGPINTAWFVDQKILEEQGKYVYDPERAQKILAEATGLPADIVIETSWTAAANAMSLLYASENNDGLIPVTVKPGQEFTPVWGLFDYVGADGRMGAGTYHLTPVDALQFLRERMGDPDGTYGREERQSDFLVQTATTIINPVNFLQMLQQIPRFIQQSEEVDRSIQVTSYLPSSLDADGDGAPELYEFMDKVLSGSTDKPGIFEIMGAASVLRPTDFAGMLNDLASSAVHLDRVVPSPTSPQALLVSDGHKFTVNGNTDVFGEQSPAERKEYWEPVREWVHETVFGNSSELPENPKVMLLGDSILSNTKIPETLHASLPNVSFVGTEPHFADHDLMTELHPKYTSERLLTEMKDHQQEIFVNGVPNVVVLQIGSNDLPAGISTEQTLENITQIVEILRASNPDVRIVFGEVPPTTQVWNSSVPGLNTSLQQLALSLNTTNSPIIVADVADINPKTELSSDGVHQLLGGTADEKIVTGLLSALSQLGLQVSP